MAEALCLVDSNILIRWVQPADPDYALVESALTRLVRSGAILCYASQNLGEFWNASTRPLERNGFGLSPAETDRRARQFESRLRLLPDGLAIHEEWRRLLVDYGVSGVQVHDAHLVATMSIHEVNKILTFNTKDFARFAGIEALHPAAVTHPSI